MYKNYVELQIFATITFEYVLYKANRTNSTKIFRFHEVSGYLEPFERKLLKNSIIFMIKF